MAVLLINLWNNNSPSQPTLLGAGINTKGTEFNASIASDESHLFFGSWVRPDNSSISGKCIGKNENEN